MFDDVIKKLTWQWIWCWMCVKSFPILSFDWLSHSLIHTQHGQRTKQTPIFFFLLLFLFLFLFFSRCPSWAGFFSYLLYFLTFSSLDFTHSSSTFLSPLSPPLDSPGWTGHGGGVRGCEEDPRQQPKHSHDSLSLQQLPHWCWYEMNEERKREKRNFWKKERDGAFKWKKVDFSDQFSHEEKNKRRGIYESAERKNAKKDRETYSVWQTVLMASLS